MKRNWWKLAVVLVLVVAVGAVLLAKNDKPGTQVADSSAEVASGLPALIELGADKCNSCKTMKPIIEELQANYKDRLEVVSINVWEDRKAIETYRVETIPTQVFLDAEGKEFFRHQGVLTREEILKKFEEQGIKL